MILLKITKTSTIEDKMRFRKLQELLLLKNINEELKIFSINKKITETRIEGKKQKKKNTIFYNE